jgi:hypothetical protein
LPARNSGKACPVSQNKITNNKTRTKKPEKPELKT